MGMGGEGKGEAGRRRGSQNLLSSTNAISRREGIRVVGFLCPEITHKYYGHLDRELNQVLQIASWHSKQVLRYSLHTT